MPVPAPLLALGKPLLALAKSPKLWLVAAGASLVIGSFQVGRQFEARSHAASIQAAVEEALKEQMELTEDLVRRTKDRAARLEEFEDGRTDQSSIDWAAVPIPDSEHERLRNALNGL